MLWVLEAAAQTVRIEVVARDLPEGVRLVAETTWLGEDRTSSLVDDGTAPLDRPGDGVYVTSWSGDPVRILPVWIVAVDADGERTLAGFDEVIAAEDDRLVYALSWTTPPQVRRVAAALPARAMEVADTAVIAASLGWCGLVMAAVAWLARRPAEER